MARALGHGLTGSSGLQFGMDRITKRPAVAHSVRIGGEAIRRRCKAGDGGYETYSCQFLQGSLRRPANFGNAIIRLIRPVHCDRSFEELIVRPDQPSH